MSKKIGNLALKIFNDEEKVKNAVGNRIWDRFRFGTNQILSLDNMFFTSNESDAVISFCPRFASYTWKKGEWYSFAYNVVMEMNNRVAYLEKLIKVLDEETRALRELK